MPQIGESFLFGLILNTICGIIQGVKGVNFNYMNKVYVTGDCHGIAGLLKIEDFAKQHPELDKSDVMIVTGDWGVIWNPEENDHERELLKWAEMLPFSLFVVLGSHENYDRIEKLPVFTLYGGPVWQDPRYPQVVYAQSGNVYTINGKTFFCFNGGLSFDKEYREERKTWWPQELPTDEQMNHGLDALAAANNAIDYVVTHDCPLTGLKYLPHSHRHEKYDNYISQLNHYLEKVFGTVSFKKWYCGRFHCDSGDMKITFMFETIKEI